ncbi:MAG TPA: hypothetical protein PK504_03650 [Ferruginibacter sp.]|nr:hypothetical protein [Ferruginibacter sp.]HRE63224.1 hypothetical protein [Ferruginibacter sp.]
MSDELKNILSHLNKDVEQEKLLEYLNKQLSPGEQHELEASMQDDPFASDALDGLSQMKEPVHISSLVQQLNKDLTKQLDKKKKRKRRQIIETPWFFYSIIIILALAILGYIVIKKFLAV